MKIFNKNWLVGLVSGVLVSSWALAELPTIKVDDKTLTNVSFVSVANNGYASAEYIAEPALGAGEVFSLEYQTGYWPWSSSRETVQQKSESGRVSGQAFRLKASSKLEIAVYDESMAPIGFLRQVRNGLTNRQRYVFYNRNKEAMGRALRIEGPAGEVDIVFQDNSGKLVATVVKGSGPQDFWRIATLPTKSEGIDPRILRFIASFEARQDSLDQRYVTTRSGTMTVLVGAVAAGAFYYAYVYGAPWATETAKWLYHGVTHLAPNFFYDSVRDITRAAIYKPSHMVLETMASSGEGLALGVKDVFMESAATHPKTVAAMSLGGVAIAAKPVMAVATPAAGILTKVATGLWYVAKPVGNYLAFLARRIAHHP